MELYLLLTQICVVMPLMLVMWWGSSSVWWESNPLWARVLMSMTYAAIGCVYSFTAGRVYAVFFHALVFRFRLKYRELCIQHLKLRIATEDLVAYVHTARFMEWLLEWSMWDVPINEFFGDDWVGAPQLPNVPNPLKRDVLDRLNPQACKRRRGNNFLSKMYVSLICCLVVMQRVAAETLNATIMFAEPASVYSYSVGFALTVGVVVAIVAIVGCAVISRAVIRFTTNTTESVVRTERSLEETRKRSEEKFAELADMLRATIERSDASIDAVKDQIAATMEVVETQVRDVGTSAYEASRVVTSQKEKIDNITDRVEVAAGWVATGVQKIEQKIEPTIMLAQGAFGSVIIWKYIQIIGACLALGRALFSRLRRSREVPESVSSGSVFKIWDMAIALIFLPMLLKDGTKSAFSMFGVLRKVGSMARDVCIGLNFFSSVFSDENTPFTGQVFVSGLQDATNDLMDRVEEKQEGKDDEDDDSLPELEPMSAAESSEIYDEFGNLRPCLVHGASASSAECPQCVRCNPKSVPLPDDQCPNTPHWHSIAGTPVLCRKYFDKPSTYSKAQRDVFKGLSDLWDSTENPGRQGVGYRPPNVNPVSTLKSLAGSTPWLAPVILLLTFGTFVFVVRYFEKKQHALTFRLPKWREDAKVATTLHEIPEAYHKMTGAAARLARRKHQNKPVYNRKPWIDYDANGEEVYTDELGHVFKVAGRQALRSAAKEYVARYGGGTSPDQLMDEWCRELKDDGMSATTRVTTDSDGPQNRTTYYGLGQFTRDKLSQGPREWEQKESVEIHAALRKYVADTFEGVIFVAATPLDAASASSVKNFPSGIVLIPTEDYESDEDVEIDVPALSKNQRKKRNAKLRSEELAKSVSFVEPAPEEAKEALVRCPNPSSCDKKCGKWHGETRVNKSTTKKQKSDLDSSKPSCFYCKQDGHIASDCAKLLKAVCGTCGGVGHTSAYCQKNASAASSSGSKAVPEKKEGLCNGMNYSSLAASRSIGWCEAGSKDAHGVQGMNFTACLNGFVTMKHIFGENHTDSTPINFWKANAFWSYTAKDAKVIGNDLIWFPRGEEKVDNITRPRFPWLPNMQCAKKSVEAGKKVWLVTNGDRSCAVADPSPVLVDGGNVMAIIGVEPGEEKAVYKVSSTDGSCGSPVLNEFNHVVGWHCSRIADANCFIPCTTTIVQKASGSIPSFRLAPSQL